MTRAGPSTHDRIRRIVAQDLRPVRPLWSPVRRVVLVLPFAAVIATLAALEYGLRADIDQLGGFVGFGLSALEGALGLIVLGLALRLAIPGSIGSNRMLWIVSALTVAAILAITVGTYAAHASYVPPGSDASFWYLCVLGPLKFGAPLLIASSVLAARAFPTRPAATGALCGLAAGLVADSGWRLTCWVTVPAHVLGAHALAIAALVAVGAAAGGLIDRVRNRQ